MCNSQKSVAVFSVAFQTHLRFLCDTIKLLLLNPRQSSHKGFICYWVPSRISPQGLLNYFNLGYDVLGACALGLLLPIHQTFIFACVGFRTCFWPIIFGPLTAMKSILLALWSTFNFFQLVLQLITRFYCFVCFICLLNCQSWCF